MNDETTVVLVVTATVAMVYIARLRSAPADILRQPGRMVRIGFGGVVLMVFLLALARLDGGLASALAWVVFLGATMVYGGTAAKAISTGVQNARVPTRGTDYADPAGRSANPNDWTGQRSAYWGQ